MVEQPDLVANCERDGNNTPHPFILALDGDIDFRPKAVHDVLKVALRNNKIALCCGRIHPAGGGALYRKMIPKYKANELV